MVFPKSPTCGSLVVVSILKNILCWFCILTKKPNTKKKKKKKKKEVLARESWCWAYNHGVIKVRNSTTFDSRHVIFTIYLELTTNYVINCKWMRIWKAEFLNLGYKRCDKVQHFILRFNKISLLYAQIFCIKC